MQVGGPAVRGTLGDHGAPTSSAVTVTLIIVQVLERSSGSTSSGTSDMSGLTGLGLALGLSPRSGLTRRSVSERVLIPEEDLHGLNAAASPAPPAPPSTSREKRTMLR